MTRVTDQPILQELGKKYGKSPVQVVLAWAVNNGRSAIPKSVIDWQIQQNLEPTSRSKLKTWRKLVSWKSRQGSTIPALIIDGDCTVIWRESKALLRE